MSTKDPGPPTWAEARDGHQLDRAKCADLIRRSNEALSAMPAGEAGARRETLHVLFKASVEWQHWNAAHARAVAFIRVHPTMAGESIYTKCPHDDGGKFPTCWTGSDEGFYRAPEAKVVPVVSFYEREVGADDGDEDEEVRT